MSLEIMQNRLKYLGGARQQDRMIVDKARSLNQASKYSYQAAHFQLISSGTEFNGVMNSGSLNMDYDEKIISTLNKDIQTGDVFHWQEDNSNWICYSQDKTELAYFRGHCRRCSYSLEWVDKNKSLQSAFIAVIGPSTNNTDSGEETRFSVDYANADLVVLITDNKRNSLYFNQYQTFVLRGFTYRIKQIDNLSMPGVIQMNCERIYSNRIEDDVENDISNAWNVQPVIEHYLHEEVIVGDNPIKPLFTYQFDAAVDVSEQGYWEISDCQGNLNNSIPYELDFPTTDDYRHCRVKWTNKFEGNFILKYYNNDNVLLGQKFIVVESLL